MSTITIYIKCLSSNRRSRG